MRFVDRDWCLCVDVLLYVIYLCVVPFLFFSSRQLRWEMGDDEEACENHVMHIICAKREAI